MCGRVHLWLHATPAQACLISDKFQSLFLSKKQQIAV